MAMATAARPMSRMIESPAVGSHVCTIRVYYEDTDSEGIVYYANYLKFAERARTEMLRDLGFEQAVLRARHGMSFVVRRCAVDYRRPARLDDLLEVHSRILKIGGASLSARQSVRRGGEDVADLTIDLACIGANHRPVRMPADLRGALAKFSSGGAPILTAWQP